MLNKKKTNYESKGFVRRIAGSIFSSRGGASGASGGGDDVIAHIPVKIMSSTGTGGNEGKWRPRKKQFERLDAEDEDGDSFLAEGTSWMNIKSAFSTESDAGEYKRENLYERKKTALKHQVIASTNPRKNSLSVSNAGKKRDLSNFYIKPPTKDTVALRVNSATKKKKPKHSVECNHPPEYEGNDPFAPANSATPATDLLGVHYQAGTNVPDGTGDDDFPSDSYHRRRHDDESSRQTDSSKQTSSTKHTHPSQHHPSFNTVSSDPSDFFSKDAVNVLTQQNLARMAAMSGTYSSIPEEQTKFGGYQNQSLRSNASQTKFYQFAIDEDKESTVVESNVLPLSFGEDDDQLIGEAAMRDSDDEEDSADDKSDNCPSVASKGTRIQKRSPLPNHAFTGNQTISHIKTPQTDLFFESSLEQNPRQDFCLSLDRDDFKHTVVGNDDDTFAELIQNRNVSERSDPFCSSESVSNSFLQSGHQSPTAPKGASASYGRQASAQSLSYSPSPVRNREKHALKKSPPPPFGRHIRDGRLPLSPLSNVKQIATQSNPPLVSPRHHSSRPERNLALPSVGAMEVKDRKPDPDESWFDASHRLKSSSGSKTQMDIRMRQIMMKKPDPFSSFNAFGTASSKTLMEDNRSSTKKQRRDPSFSDPFVHEAFEDVGTSDPFNHDQQPDFFPSAEDVWGFEEKFAPKKIVDDEGSTKENLQTLKLNGKYEGPIRESALPTPAALGFQNGKRMTGQTNDEYVDIDSSVNSEDKNEDSNDDDDNSVVDVPAAPMGIQNLQKEGQLSSNLSLAAHSRSFHSELNRSVHSNGLPKHHRSRPHDHDASRANDDNDDASLGKVSISASYTKPLALPSNAIMASMLFRTHYDNDKTAVEKKIKAKEEENVRHKSSRRGDIPNSVHADYDYMTTVSSFSDGTATFQEAWKKPSRDLLDYFSKARTLDMESEKYLQSQQANRINSAKGASLFEA